MTELERTLTGLQRVLREARDAGRHTVLSRKIPADLATADVAMLHLTAEERAAMEAVSTAISADTRFEHLGRRADDVVWRFACLVFLDRSRSHVQPFLHEHARDLLHLTCYFGIENLTVHERRRVVGLEMMPVDDPEVPRESVWFDLRKPVGCVVAAPASGTEYEPMKDRAAERVDHSLRVLRVALREHQIVPDELLRFRRGTSYSFGGRIAGARRRSGEAWNLDFDDALAELAVSQPVSALEIEPLSDIQRQANVALRWIERGMFADEYLESLLFHFFALEAILGRKSDRLKARGLAFRRAMLSVAVRGYFSDPDHLYFLYEKVRSAAVHGAKLPMVDRASSRRFAWDVRRALNEYLQYASDTGLKKRGKLLSALDHHHDREQMLAWLLENSAENWNDVEP